MSSKMEENLLKTLDAIRARETVSNDTSLPGFNDSDYDKETGEWVGEPPEGYEPIKAPDIEVVKKETAVKEFLHSDVRTDYIRVRDTTYAIQEATMFMLQQAAKLAANTEAPRAFSVFRELGELMRGLNKDLMDNQKNFKSVTMGEEPKDDTEVNVETDGNGNTRVTVGKTNRRSSRDLMEVARKLQEEAAEEDRRKKKEAKEAEAVDAEVSSVQTDVNETPDADDADK